MIFKFKIERKDNSQKNWLKHAYNYDTEIDSNSLEWYGWIDANHNIHIRRYKGGFDTGTIEYYILIDPFKANNRDQAIRYLYDEICNKRGYIINNYYYNEVSGLVLCKK